MWTGAVRHDKARAIFLDPGEGRPGELSALKAAVAAGDLEGKQCKQVNDTCLLTPVQ